MPGGAGTPGGYGGGPDFGGGEPGGGYTGRPAPHRDTSAQRATQAALDAAAAQRSADALNAQRAEQQAAEGRVDLGFQEALRKQKIAEDLKNELDEDFLFEDAKVKAPTTLKPTTVIPERGTPFAQGLIKTVTPQKISPTYYQDRSKIGGETYGERAEAGIKRGGIGTTLKNVALGILAPQLLAGTKLAPLYQGYRTYQTAKRLIPKIGDVEKTIRTAFTPRLTPKLTTGTKTTTPLVARDREGPRVKTVAEQVATGQGLESGAKLLGVENTQKAELFRRKRTVENILREGSYQGRNLTSGQRDNLMNYIEQINKFLVPVQQGI